MVQVVTLEQAKIQCRVTHNAEDDLLNLYIDAAGEHIEKYLNRSIPGASVKPTPSIPAAIKSAALLIIADLYENREAQIVSGTISENKTLVNLLFPYRVDIGI